MELRKYPVKEMIKKQANDFEYLGRGRTKGRVERNIVQVHPLQKKGDKKYVNSYRAISLLLIMYKVLLKVLLKRWEN